MKKNLYNIDLCKGTGLISESLALFEIYKQNKSKAEMLKGIIDNNLLGKTSEKRISDILEFGLYKRYVSYGAEVPVYLHELRNANISLEKIKQILFIYSCKANPVLLDFVIQVYWKTYYTGNRKFEVAYARKFIADAFKSGVIKNKWSDGTIKRMSSYLISTLKDFNLIDSKNNMLNYTISDIAANYLLHILYFHGFNENQILEAKEWMLFGLKSEDEVLEVLKRLSFTGNFVIQHSGEITRITWNNKSMREFINGITK
jgi:hypothetical protein